MGKKCVPWIRKHFEAHRAHIIYVQDGYFMDHKNKASRAPLYETLLAYRDSKRRSFHVPGHKNGQAYRHLVEQAEAGQSPAKDIVNEEHQHNGEIQNDGEKNVNQKVEHFSSVDEHGADLESVERLSVEGANSELELVPVRSFLEMMEMDVTEITGTDDLHHPEGVIEEAQELAADCFGAEESFFLVGGSTAGNLSILLTVCDEPNSIVLVQRNVHKSVIHGLMLAGARAVFLEPWVDPVSGLAVMPSVETVQGRCPVLP